LIDAERFIGALIRISASQPTHGDTTMFTNTKIALSTAIILDTASVTMANYALAEGVMN
jgi:hypothetical protein